jgi:hypothetical protein
MTVLQLAQVTDANSMPERGRMDLGARRRDDALGLIHGTMTTSGLLAAGDSRQQR